MDRWRPLEEESKCCHQRWVQCRGPISDILVWVECCSTMVAVLAARYPGKTPQQMGYLKTIVKAQRSFVGEGWVTYDSCYRRRSKSLNLDIIDFTLYNEIFTGRAYTVPATSTPPKNASMHPSTGQSWPCPLARLQQAPLCQLFNGRSSNRCTFNPCKFAHLCADCRGRHPVSACRGGLREARKGQ